MERWLFYIDKYEGRPKAPHLLFHMATGSGKTVLMAALILDLYRRGYGTDQEKHFIKYMNDQAERLRTRYDDFYLLRNEKAVKLFAFNNGQAFEPDFVLFLRKKNDEQSTILQLFIEPKGEQLRPKDDWKRTFLAEIKGTAQLETVFQGKDYTVLGLPFFNEHGQTNTDFKAAFDVHVE